MQSLFDFIIKPKNERYDNKKYIDGQELLVNTEISDHRYVSRTGIVLNVPKSGKTELRVGDEVILHHNVFRRWYNQYGVEKNSRGYYKDNLYFVKSDQIFLYKRNNKWNAPKGFCFVKPIKSTDILNNEKEQALRGIIKHVDDDISGLIEKEDLVGFTPSSEYEFIVEGERMYRVLTNSISIKYERQGNEKEYNPSWT